MKELERLFPTEIGEKLADGARLRKSRVVKARQANDLLRSTHSI